MAIDVEEPPRLEGEPPEDGADPDALVELQADAAGYDPEEDSPLIQYQRIVSGQTGQRSKRWTNAQLIARMRDERYPVALTPFVHKTIVEVVRKGYSFHSACDRCDLSPSTFIEWRRYGWRFPIGHKLRTFITDLRVAMADSRDAHERDIRDNASSGKDWKGNAYLLERREPKIYRSNPVEVSGQAQAMIFKTIGDMARPEDPAAKSMDAVMSAVLGALDQFPEAKIAVAKALLSQVKPATPPPQLAAPDDDDDE